MIINQHISNRQTSFSHINALTGDVVKYGKEKDDDYNKSPSRDQTSKENSKTAKPQSSTTYIDEAAAKAAALKHAGVSNVTGYKSELDHEHGVPVYEIEFKANGYEYDYEIDAVSGAIIKSEKEID